VSTDRCRTDNAEGRTHPFENRDRRFGGATWSVKSATEGRADDATPWAQGVALTR
jgi:hypothetical protein